MDFPLIFYVKKNLDFDRGFPWISLFFVKNKIDFDMFFPWISHWFFNRIKKKKIIDFDRGISCTIFGNYA